MAVLIQGVLPFLGHATILKTLRALVIPFVILFAVMLGFAIPHATTHGVAHAADWQTYMEGLAFTIVLSGLGWTECGNDYTRYCKPETSKRGIVGWVFLGTAVPEILIMTLGAAVGTFLVEGRDPGQRLHRRSPTSRSSRPGSSCVFLIFSIVQLFAINSLDLYSSGVTLQAMGVTVKRDQAVVIDCVLALGRDDVRHLQHLVQHVPEGLRRRRDRLDRPVGRHLPGRLVDAEVPLRARRAPADRPRAASTTAPPASTGRPSSPRSSACSPPSRRCRPPSRCPAG